MERDDGGIDTPLRNPNYFVGPLRTLRASLSAQNDISVQDIADAYERLCSRVRECGETLYTIGPSSLHNYQAFGTFKQFKQSVFAALKRDIQMSSVGRGGSTEDIALLCHDARLFLSDLFKFRNLYSVLTDEETSELLQSITVINDGSRVGPKSLLLTSWILSTQELPSRVLMRCKDNVVKFLKYATTECEDVALRAIQTTQHFLGNSTSIFLRSFVEGLLALVLQHIMSQNKSLQNSSSETVASFAHALLLEDAACSDVKEKASAIVGRFIEKNNSRRVSPRLESLFVFASPDGDGELQPSTLSEAVHHIRTVVSLITISGPQIFSRPTSLKLLLNALKTAKDTFKERGIHHKRSRQRTKEGKPRDRTEEFTAMKHLSEAAWRSVVWAYSQLSPGTLCPPSRSSCTSKRRLEFPEVRESAFKIVEQEFGVGMGILLVAHFLNASGDDPSCQRDIAKVLRILSKLLERTSWMEAGLRLFRRLVDSLLGGPVHAAKVWSDRRIVALELLDGDLFGSEDVKEICTTISRIDLSVDPFDVVPPLTEAEVAGSSWEELVTMWSEAVHHKLRDGDRLMSNEIVDIWQALLLARAQLTQGNGHLSVVPERADFLSSVLTSFVLASQEIRPDVEHIQSLIVVRQLWSVVKNVFAKACTEKMAKDILTCILTQTFSLEEESVKEAWSNLCVELVEGGTPKALLADRDVPSTEQLTEAKKVVWKLVTERTLVRLHSPGLSTDSVTHFELSRDLLCVPIGQWELTEDVLWDELLRSSIAIGDIEKSSLTLLDSVTATAKAAMDEGKDTVGVFHGLLLVLDELYANNNLQGYPAKLFSIVHDILVESYPPAAATVDNCSILLALLSNLLGRGSATLRLSLLSSVKDALIPWFADRHMILAVREYNEMLQLMYAEAINTLLVNNPTQALVTEFADFLAAPFLRNNIPRPAIGPMSFKSFWEVVERSLKLNNDNCPDSLKLCLYRLQEFGHPLPVWLQESSHQSPISILHSPVSDVVLSSVADSPVSPKVPLSILALRASPVTKRTPLTRVNEWMNGLSPSPVRASDVGSPISPAPMTLKRTSILTNRPLKRQKTESNAEASTSKLARFLPQSRAASKAPPSLEEISRSLPSPVTPSIGRSRRVLLDVEVEPMPSSLKRRYRTISPEEYTGSSYAPPQVKLEDCSVLEEYSVWETGLSSQDVTDILDAPTEGKKSVISSDRHIETSDTSMEDSNTSDWLYKDEIVSSESLSVSHDLAKRIDRSQTVPAALPSYSPSMSQGSYLYGGNNLEVATGSQASPHLRRSATSPLPLDMLLCIKKCVAGDGADEMQTQVLAQTAEVAHDIAGLLRDAMAKKLGDRQPSRPPGS